MIAFLSGKLLEKRPGSVIVDVNGVGYEVVIPLSTFYEIGETGTDVQIRVHTNVREDAIQLFGFVTQKEKELFLRLLSVQGVGAKSAISMLSGMNAEEIIEAVRAGNLARLTAIPGVGRKTAERLVVELRDKIGELSAGAPVDASIGTGTGAVSDTVFDDALSALVNLGYQKSAAERALQKAIQDGAELNVQKLLRSALQRLAR